MSPDRTVVVDCRWLGIGGPGRTTELMLRGLKEDPPPGRWVLWGREASIAPLAWPGAAMAGISTDPRLLLGQRHTFDIPAADFVLFMHQQRPLRPLPSATVVYDTIALRFGATPAVRSVKRLFLRRIAASSRCLLTISEHSKASIERDLGVPVSKIDVVRFPFDPAFAERVHSLRRTTAVDDVALYVGGFRPHKNLARLLEAFHATTFRKDGGRLVLVGGSASQADDLLGRMTPEQRRSVVVEQACPQDALDRLFAGSLFLVQPSLEEGFGLPAWEAMSCGLPVCVSDGGALPEVVDDDADPFPATSVEAMTASIDDCAARARTWTEADRITQSESVRRRAPTIREFAGRFRHAVDVHTQR